MKKLFFLFFALLPLFAFGQVANKWVKYYNAVGNDRSGMLVTTDASGNAFAAGQANLNAFQQDVIITKYDSLGKELWVYQYAGPYGGNSRPTKIMTDATGNLYVLAHCTQGTTVSVLFKLDPGGTRQWLDTIVTQTVTGGYGNWLYDMTFNSNGEIVVGGGLEGYTVAGYPYWFMATYNAATGAQVWRNLTAVDYAYNHILGIVAAPAGVMYAAGYESHGNPPGERLVFRKYNANGTIAWQIIYDADSTTGENELAQCIKTDASGNLYLLGYATTNNKNNYDFLLRKYDPNGNVIWSKTYSSAPNAGNDKGSHLYVTSSGEAYAYGTVNDEVHLVKFDVSGNVMWARPYRFDPNWPTYIGGMDVDPATGNVVISGTERRSSGWIAAFAAKYKSNGDSMWVEHMPLNYGGAAQVHIGADHSVYIAGTGMNAMITTRLTDADVTLKRNVSGPRLYDFNDNTGKTGIKLDSLNAGNGDILGMLLNNGVANTSWCAGTTMPNHLSKYRWVLENTLTAFTSAIFSIDLTSLISGLAGFHGMMDPSRFSIYQRPLDGEGEFCKLATTFANGMLSAHITHLSEFFIGSDTDSFNYKPVSIPNTAISKATAIRLSPNPASANTTISFTLAEASTVELMLYDITGRMVHTAGKQPMGIGSHTLKINLSSLYNGIYFCKLTVDGITTETLKLTVHN